MKPLREPSAPPGRGTFIRYSSGNFAKSLKESTFSLLYLFYLVDVVGVDPAIAGSALLLSTLVDAALNPLLGSFIDRKLSQRWSYQQMIVAAAPISAAFFLLLFLLPISWPFNTGMDVFLATVLYRAASTLVDVPHNSLLARLSPDGYDRVRLSTWRFFFSSLGNVAIVFLLAPTFMAAGPTSPSSFLAPAALISAIYLAVITYCATGLNVTAVRTVEGSAARSLSAFGDLARNTRLLRILLIFVLAAALVTVFFRVTVFYAKAGLGGEYWAAHLVGAQMCGQLIALPFWQTVAAKIEKTSTAIAAQAIVVISIGVFFATSPNSLWGALPLFFLVGIGITGLTVMNWALVPDAIDYTEAACGRRHEALTFGVLLFLNKAATGFSVALVGWMLAAIGYDSSSPRNVVEPLVAYMTAIPIVGALASILVLRGLKLTYREHRELVQKP